MATTDDHVAAIQGAKTEAEKIAAEKAAVEETPNGPTESDGSRPSQDPLWEPGDED